MSMQISRFSSLPAQKIAFKGDYLLDTGAGNSDEFSGNVAGKGETDTGEPVELESKAIPKSHSGEEWVANWSRITANMIPKDDKNARIVAFLPGPSKLDKNGKQVAALTNLGGYKITSDMLKDGLKKEGVEVEKLLILNDGHAHNTNILNNCGNIIRDPQFVGGVNVFPGGGCGGASVRREGDKFVSTAEERGHELYPKHLVQHNLLTKDMKSKVQRLSVEEYSTSVPAAIRNFAKAIGFNDKQAKTLADTKEGRIVTQHQVELDLNDEEQRKQSESLKKTNMFKDLGLGEDGKQRYQLLKPIGIGVISPAQHSKGLKVAGTEFFRGVGIILSRFETQNMGTDVFVPTTFAHRMSQALDSKGIDAVKVVQKTAWNNLDDANRRNVVGSPERQRVTIKSMGDPCSIQNIKTLLSGDSPEGDGFREVKIPLSGKSKVTATDKQDEE